MLVEEEDEYWLWDEVLAAMPRTSIKHARKIAADVAVEFRYAGERGEKGYYRLVSYRLDHKQGTQWVKADGRSREHRHAVKWVRTRLQMQRLREMTE